MRNYKSRTQIHLVYLGGLDLNWNVGTLREWIITHDDDIDYSDFDRMNRLSDYCNRVLWEYYGPESRGKFRIFYNQESLARKYSRDLKYGTPDEVLTPEYQEADW